MPRQLMAASAGLSLLWTGSPLAAVPGGPVTFNMVVSGGAATCLPTASATVKVTPGGPVESMNVAVQGLRPNTKFALFVIQVPKAPFGVSWYLGDIATDNSGRGRRKFSGRFSIETFAVAVGSAPAPV